MLLELRNINLDTIDLDEAVVALAVAELVKAKYETMMVPAPEWILTSVESLTREVKARHRDYLERALKNAKARAEAFKTRDQKAAEVAAEIAKLEAALGQA